MQLSWRADKRKCCSPVIGPANNIEAARFLDQATFGPRLQDIAQLRQQGYASWIDDQFAARISLQKPFMDWIRSQSSDVPPQLRQEAWFIQSAQLADPVDPTHLHDDQLRKRVAFALSQLLVVSDKGALAFQPGALTDYYDTLARHAFGNYRDLLEATTLHPAMGRFSQMLGNRRADAALNIRPDENFAREVLQLFSIGLVQLHSDGTAVRIDGQVVPTYNEAQVRGFARVFTGWNFSACAAASYANCHPPTSHDAAWTTPMEPVESFHDSSNDKQLLDYPGVALPQGLLKAGGDARQELKIALDNIFNHPNVGPFVARHLIQRLVTSNPSAGYVGRVAAAFNNNGQDVRGDMKSVIRAVLLDHEARYGHLLAPTTFGKLREPVTKLVRLWRVAPPRSVSGRVFRYSHLTDQYGQFPLSAPSVFNFYKPDFAPIGEVRNAGLVAPEFQIATDSQLVSAPNDLGIRIFFNYVGSLEPNVWEDANRCATKH
ncbi:MAG: DUF1800 domain-containing protein [Phycisphaerales bacterium]|nr:DUF1800 domain-containing protein [Phycisphaerales bacterium]